MSEIDEPLQLAVADEFVVGGRWLEVTGDNCHPYFSGRALQRVGDVGDAQFEFFCHVERLSRSRRQRDLFVAIGDNNGERRPSPRTIVAGGHHVNQSPVMGQP